MLDHELKSEYQRWLHERDGDHDDYDGHPDRTPDEIREWAQEHHLPYFDQQVHFPDARIEYEEPDGRCLRSLLPDAPNRDCAGAMARVKAALAALGASRP